MPAPSRTLRYQQRQRLRELLRTCQWWILIACYKTGVEKETAFPGRVPGQLTNAPTEQTTRLCADDIWRKRLYWQGHIDAGDSNNHAVAVMQTHFLIYINDFITIFVWLSNAHGNTLKDVCVCTCSCPFMLLMSSAFFSRFCTQTFLFCLQREAAALFLSRNFRLFSSGSSLVVLRRRPPVLVVCWAGGAGDTCTGQQSNTNQLRPFRRIKIKGCTFALDWNAPWKCVLRLIIILFLNLDYYW